VAAATQLEEAAVCDSDIAPIHLRESDQLLYRRSRPFATADRGCADEWGWAINIVWKVRKLFRQAVDPTTEVMEAIMILALWGSAMALLVVQVGK
jgi:hypothetical protein